MNNEFKRMHVRQLIQGGLFCAGWAKAILMATGVLGILGAVFRAAPVSAASLGTTQVYCNSWGSSLRFGPLSQSLSCDKNTTGYSDT